MGPKRNKESKSKNKSEKNKKNKKIWDFFLQNHEKLNHKIMGITNCEITKCVDPLCFENYLKI
jgi:hypothetical protein